VRRHIDLQTSAPSRVLYGLHRIVTRILAEASDRSAFSGRMCIGRPKQTGSEVCAFASTSDYPENALYSKKDGLASGTSVAGGVLLQAAEGAAEFYRGLTAKRNRRGIAGILADSCFEHGETLSIRTPHYADRC
jgi:hypothetical protein